MKWFYDLRIASKLLSIFSVVVILVVVLGSFATIKIGKVTH